MTDNDIALERFSVATNGTTYKDTEKSKKAASVNWEETIKKAKAARKNKK
jgi:hypothetical protein